MASRIGIAGDVNTGKSRSRKTIKKGQEVFLLQPSVKRNYLTDEEGNKLKPFIYRPSAHKNISNWEEVYKLPVFTATNSLVNSPSQAIKVLDHVFSRMALDNGIEKVRSSLTAENLYGNIQLINHSITEASDWLNFISNWMPWIKVVIVADFTHYISNVISDRAFINRKIGGEAYQRFWELAADALTTFILSTDDLRDDLIIVTEFHTEWDKERQRYELFMPAGNMLKEEFKPESYFDTLLFTDVNTTIAGDGSETNDYRFVTRRTALYPQARSADLFDELYIPNDLELVLETYRKEVMS